MLHNVTIYHGQQKNSSALTPALLKYSLEWISYILYHVKFILIPLFFPFLNYISRYLISIGRNPDPVVNMGK